MNRWRLMSHDPFARETYCAGEFDGEARARRAMKRLQRWLEIYQDEGVRDWLWLEPVEEPAPAPDPPKTAAPAALGQRLPRWRPVSGGPLRSGNRTRPAAPRGRPTKPRWPRG